MTYDLTMTDTKTNEDWEIDFVYVAFPGLKTMGYRVEGFKDGEVKDFGTLVISDGKLKIVQW